MNTGSTRRKEEKEIAWESSAAFELSCEPVDTPRECTPEISTNHHRIRTTSPKSVDIWRNATEQQPVPVQELLESGRLSAQRLTNSSAVALRIMFRAIIAAGVDFFASIAREDLVVMLGPHMSAKVALRMLALIEGAALFARFEYHTAAYTADYRSMCMHRWSGGSDRRGRWLRIRVRVKMPMLWSIRQSIGVSNVHEHHFQDQLTRSA